MISRSALLGVACLAIAASPALAVGKKKDVSWGKPGISFVDYRADALECANRAYGVEVKPKPYGPVALSLGIASAFMPAALWTKLAPGEVPIYTTTYVEGYRHAVWMDTVEQLQAAVDTCLGERGYSRFRLSAGQMAKLRALPAGSSERQHFLYNLGSDAEVLAAQRI
jgi:hypothetical protein